MIAGFFETFSSNWAGPAAALNVKIFIDMGLALLLGLIFGYERSYHGRAAGMRTYGLVCMVSAALVAISGFPGEWYGGHVAGIGPVDPTRTIQGIVTGIGFLGAGIIMKDGFKISGLTTAASIWAAAAIGVLVGIGFYSVAVLLTLLSTGFVMWGVKFGSLLPSRRPVAVTLQFKKDFLPTEGQVRQIAAENGYEIAKGTVSIHCHNNQLEWRFVAISLNRTRPMTIADLAQKLSLVEEIESFHLSRARN